jgi:hypothetical protein
VFLRTPEDGFYPRKKAAIEFSENSEIKELIKNENYDQIKQIIDTLDQR